MFARRMHESLTALTVLAVICAVVFFVPPVASAQEPDGAPPLVAEIPAGATVEVPIYGFCLNYTYPFPGETLRPIELASDPVRKAISYASANDYVATDPWQVQLAIWYFTEGKKVAGQVYGLADEIIAYAESSAPLPEDGVTQPLLPDAVEDGIVSATIDDFANISPPNFYFLGEGTLVLKNLTDKAVEILIPYGTRFRDEQATGKQDMGIFPQPVTPDNPPTGGLLPPAVLAGLGAAVLGLGGIVTARRRRK